jgi:hypothetical protein
MLSPNHPISKPSRVAKISVKPVWRRKLDTCQKSTSINDVVPNQPTTKHQTHSNETSLLPPHDNLTISLSNNIPYPSHSHLPNDPFEEHTQSQNNNHHPHQNMHPMLHVQASIPSLNPTPPSSPSSEHKKFVEELNEAHELSALLALHLAQRNLDQQPSSTHSSPPNNLVQLENHVNNCPCCIFLQKQTIALNEHFSWIEYVPQKGHLEDVSEMDMECYWKVK